MKLGKLPSRAPWTAGVAALAATLGTSFVQAQPAAGPPPAAGQPAAAGDEQQGPKVKVERGAGGKTVYR
ncbi:MAG TPA: hypothetical protein VGG33_18195, partial [Polyangia bacterium]